jgi:hypothetical protein
MVRTVSGTLRGFWHPKWHQLERTECLQYVTENMVVPLSESVEHAAFRSGKMVR